MRKLIKATVFFFLLSFPLACITSQDLRPRLIVTTDIGGDPDDLQSLIRLFLYLNEFNLEGVIVSASGTTGELGIDTTRADIVFKTIEAYKTVYPTLQTHGPFPTAEYLEKCVKKGNPHRGNKSIGTQHHTEASEWLYECMIRESDQPLNITIWGGSTDLAQALWKVRATKNKKEQTIIFKNLRIFSIHNQDETGEWIMDQFPECFYILSSALPGEDKREGAYRGMYLDGDYSITSRDWITANIQKNHGALCALYPLKTWTKPNPNGCMKEGDTPSWFYFLPNGLSSPDEPQWGCWGGRFKKTSNKHYIDDCDADGDSCSRRKTVWRWRNDFQNDFAARAEWCIKPYKEANHAPVIKVNNEESKHPVSLNIFPMEVITFDASATHDPENDSLSFKWWIYNDVTKVEIEKIIISSPTSAITNIQIPQRIHAPVHLILEVKDNHKPYMTSYKRFILTSTEK